MAEDVWQQQTLEAIKQALITYLPSKVPSFNPNGTYWATSDAYIDVKDCPAISIADRGWSVADVTCRSMDQAGNIVEGGVQIRMTVEIQPWLKAGGSTNEPLLKSLREYTAGIEAVLESYYQLGDPQLICRPRGGADYLTNEGGRNMWYGVAQIRADVDVFIRQGETALS
jgi:hypothetical protein